MYERAILSCTVLSLTRAAELLQDKPYLRFAMVIPMPQLVDCTVTQGSTTHTWSGYGTYPHTRQSWLAIGEV